MWRSKHVVIFSVPRYSNSPSARGSVGVDFIEGCQTSVLRRNLYVQLSTSLGTSCRFHTIGYACSGLVPEPFLSLYLYRGTPLVCGPTPLQPAHGCTSFYFGGPARMSVFSSPSHITSVVHTPMCMPGYDAFLCSFRGGAVSEDKLCPLCMLVLEFSMLVFAR